MDLLNRKEIAGGVFLSTHTDARFKKNRVSFCFFTQLDREKVSARAVVPKILTNSCRRYPDLRSLNARLSALYAASLSDGHSNIGDTECVSVGITVIDDRYALDGEKVIEEGINILLDCVFDPLLDGDGAFKQSVVTTEKRTVTDIILAELNEKREYAIKRAVEVLCEGEPYACRATVEGVEAATAESIYRAYKEMLETARIEIFCVGRNDFNDAGKVLTAAFSKIRRGSTEDCHSSLSPLKSEVSQRTEAMDVNQSKMVIGFKSDSGDVDALSLMTKIYGGSATSKLFENVREKMSLCYYCWAKYNHCKGTVVAESGVETENIGKAKDEILNQLDLIRNGGFTDEEMSHALLSLQNDLKSLNDKLSGIEMWYLIRIYSCDIVTPEEMFKRYSGVGRERIIKAANSLKLDTVYVLTGGANE